MCLEKEEGRIGQKGESLFITSAKGEKTRGRKEQESCAIAKMTAQCALHIGALKIFGTP